VSTPAGHWPYWAVQRLVGLVTSEWHLFDGQMALRGVDPIALPFDRFLNLVFAWATEGADKKSREDFVAMLMKPPPSATVEDVRRLPEWEEGAAGNDFMAQLNARRGAGRVTTQGVVNVPGGPNVAG
jgi:hypothetical protein